MAAFLHHLCWSLIIFIYIYIYDIYIYILLSFLLETSPWNHQNQPGDRGPPPAQIVTHVEVGLAGGRKKTVKPGPSKCHKPWGPSFWAMWYIYIYICVLFTRPWTKEIFPSRPWTKEIPNTFHLFNATLTCSILYWSIYCRCMYLYMIRIYAYRYDRQLTHIHTYIQTEKHRNIEHMHIRTSKSTHAHANIHTCIHA